MNNVNVTKVSRHLRHVKDVVVTPPRTAEDGALMARFLAKWEGVSGPKVATQVEGVNQEDVSRWRRDKWTWLSEEKRSAITADLARTREREREEKLIAARWFRLKAGELEEEARATPAPEGASLGDPQVPRHPQEGEDVKDVV
jgi:hypothetical protein